MDFISDKTHIEELTMSDVEGDDVPSAAPASGPMDINTAIQEVLKQALIADGLARLSKKNSRFNCVCIQDLLY